MPAKIFNFSESSIFGEDDGVVSPID